MADDLAATILAIEALIEDAGGVGRLITPRGWPHLGLVLVDAVYSLQANYDTVVKPILRRYCDAAPDLDWDNASEGTSPEHDAERLLNFLGPMPLEQRFEILNRQIGPGTAKRGHRGFPKADAVVEVARVLVEHCAVTRADFAAAAVAEPGLERAVRGVPGVGYACWKYMLSLSSVEASKPDTMVLRWLGGVIATTPSAARGASLIEDATARLQARGMEVTIRQIDHVVWRKVSGRALGRSE